MPVSVNLKSEFDVAQLEAQMKKKVERAVKLSAEYLLEESKKTVPYMDGILESSGDITTNKGEATVYYDTPYAKRLHENPQYNFRGKGQGKWLEKTVNSGSVQSGILRIMKGEIQL